MKNIKENISNDALLFFNTTRQPTPTPNLLFFYPLFLLILWGPEEVTKHNNEARSSKKMAKNKIYIYIHTLWLWCCNSNNTYAVPNTGTAYMLLLLQHHNQRIYTSVSIWNDPWVPWIQGFIPKPKSKLTVQSPLIEAQLISHDCHKWNTRIVQANFEPVLAQAILSIPLPVRAKPDRLIWSPNPKGNFSVHSLWVSYWPIKQTHKCRSTVEKAMETQEHLKGSRCCFGESVNTLPTKDNMPKRVEHIDPTCILCSQEEESCCHLFLHCPVAKAIWYASCWEFKLDWHNITTCRGIANIVLNTPPPPQTLL